MVGAGALATVSTLAVSANAAPTVIQGAGSSLLAPYWAQAVGCWDTDGSSPYANGTYINKGAPNATVVTPIAPPGVTCSPGTGNNVRYESTGSGTGQLGVFSHDNPIFAKDGVTVAFGKDPTGAGKVFPTGNIQYGLSDNALVDTDVGVYSVGTGVSYTPPGRSAITTAATYQTYTFGATGDYPVAKPLYGPLVQFPVSIDAVAMGYNKKYKGSFKLQTATGTLQLDKHAYCKIWNGEITDWGDAYLASINGVASLKDPRDTGAAPIQLVGRVDSSGTTSIFTRHLAAVCGSEVTTNHYASGTTTLPAAIQSLVTAGHLKSGSSGVATDINATVGSIGYLGPDYVKPAVSNTGVNTFNLPAALLKNAFGNYIKPNASGALKAFKGINPPALNDRGDQTLWVQSTSASAPIANPQDKSAYPIAGTTNFMAYTCYADVASVNTLRGMLTFLAGTNGATILSKAGLSALPSNWITAISQTFLVPTTLTAPKNLFLAQAGTGVDGLGDGKVNTNCTAGGIVGG
jgi:ABC-type phosphate transport system substrate-binding protein